MEMQGFKDYNNSSSRSKSPPVKIFVCKYCGRIFLNAQALGGHQNAHKKERQEEKTHKQELEMRSMMMMANLATIPLIPSSFIQLQPHGLAQHQITGNYTSSSNSLVGGGNSQFPVSNYWPGSYRLDDRALDSNVPAAGITNQLQGVADDGNGDAEKQIERGRWSRQDFELPDLNLDPPL